MWTSEHIDQWLVKSTTKVTTTDGHPIEVWEFRHQNDPSVLSAWATHFRNHYCYDHQIDAFRRGTGLSRSDYLNSIKFPDPKEKPGPSVRSGDFAEILVADYVQFVLGFKIPRLRYRDKIARNESPKGSDVVGFRVMNPKIADPRDTLAIFEAKAQFTGNKPKPRLDDAIKDSAKDHRRKAESLNALFQRLIYEDRSAEAEIVARFQDQVDRPYKDLYGAAAIFCSSVFDASDIAKSVAKKHANHKNLYLLVIYGQAFMPLVHELYRRAANEASDA